MGGLSLVLSGGGARGAYQAGVLQGLVEMAQSMGMGQPFPMVTGVSAGAINAAYWASHAQEPRLAVRGMVELWSKLKTNQVFRTDIPSLSQIALRVVTDLSLGSMTKTKRARALLNTEPLHLFLKQHIPFTHIAHNLRSGMLEAIAVTATDYASSQSVTFVHSREVKPVWERTRRHSENVAIDVEHVLASSAIPFFFPPVKVGDRFFGDGCLRNLAPLSPAIHLGAEKLVIIGVRKRGPVVPQIPMGTEGPSLARVASVTMNSLFFDGTDLDVERLNRINRTVKSIPKESSAHVSLRPIDHIWIQPTEDIAKIAFEFRNRLPATLRYLLSGLGSLDEASDLLSYLLFEPDFCKYLIDLGYRDALARKQEIEAFLQ